MKKTFQILSRLTFSGDLTTVLGNSYGERKWISESSLTGELHQISQTACLKEPECTKYGGCTYMYDYDVYNYSLIGLS